VRSYATAIRVDLEIAPSRQVRFVAGALKLALAHCVGLGDASGDLIVHSQGDVDCRRRNRIQQESADRLVYWFAAD
jgi:hypothetical protein